MLFEHAERGEYDLHKSQGFHLPSAFDCDRPLRGVGNLPLGLELKIPGRLQNESQNEIQNVHEQSNPRGPTHKLRREGKTLLPWTAEALIQSSGSCSLGPFSDFSMCSAGPSQVHVARILSLVAAKRVTVLDNTQNWTISCIRGLTRHEALSSFASPWYPSTESSVYRNGFASGTR
jgi:hypothetical protein